MRGSRLQSSSMNSFPFLVLALIALIVCYFIFHLMEVFHVLEHTSTVKSSNLTKMRLRDRATNLLTEIQSENAILARLLDLNLSASNDASSVKYEATANIQPNNKDTKGNDISKQHETSDTTAISKNINIAQSKIHPILFMDDDDFISTPLGDMMSWYGEAEGGGTCAGDFGSNLVQRWKNEKKTNCAPRDNLMDGSNLKSQIDCYLIHQTRHAGNGDNICLMKDVSINLGLYSDDSFTIPVVEKYVNTRHAIQPYIPFGRGFIGANCDMNEELWRPQYDPGWNVDWEYNAVKYQDLTRDDMACMDTVENNVLVMQRDTFANFFHDSEDFFNTFLTMAVLEWNLKDTQVYLTDLYPNGAFWDIWAKVFGYVRSPMNAWDLRNKYKSTGGRNARTCFKNIAIGIYGPAAPMTIASYNSPCHRTALIRAYSDFIIRGLEIHKETHYYQSKPKKSVQVTFMARRASVEWPEKHFCSDTESFFKCRFWDNFGIRSLGRMVSNEKALMDALKQLERESFANGAIVSVIDVDYNLLNLKEQIQNDVKTDIMVGPHGAGMMHNIFMSDRSTLIELFVDGSSNNRHFHNLAHWYGRNYIERDENNPVNIAAVVQEVRNVISGMDLSKY